MSFLEQSTPSHPIGESLPRWNEANFLGDQHDNN
jgi:hypothetical protein